MQVMRFMHVRRPKRQGVSRTEVQVPLVEGIFEALQHTHLYPETHAESRNSWARAPPQCPEAEANCQACLVACRPYVPSPAQGLLVAQSAPYLTPSSDTIDRKVPSMPEKAFFVASACIRVLTTSRGCTQVLMMAPDTDPAPQYDRVMSAFSAVVHTGNSVDTGHEAATRQAQCGSGKPHTRQRCSQGALL